MAAALYDSGREAFLTGQIQFLADTIKTALLESTAVINTATDQYLSTYTGLISSTSGALTSKTAVGGVADADNVSFTGVSGPNIGYLIMYKDTGNPATSQLIAYWDLAITPSGGDLQVVWDGAPNYIFKL